MKTIAILALLVSAQAFAQTAPKEFPADATPLAEAAMQESFSGKTYNVKLVNGTSWKWQFKTDGYFYFNTSDGFSDSGKWSTKESKLCTEGRKIGASCNEIRQQGVILHYKRDNGDIVGMTPQ